jgi:hypothetical protein
LFTDPPFLLVSPSLFQVAAELWVSMAVQLLVAGLCKGELVDVDEGDGSVVCCCRPLLGSSVGGGCEGDSCWEGEEDVSQAGGGGDRLLLCDLVEAGVDGDRRRRRRR